MAWCRQNVEGYHCFLYWRRRLEGPWLVVIVYLLVAIMKKRFQIEASLYSILQILNVTSF